MQRIVFLAVGLLALAAGVLLVVFPGPALPFFFLAGAFLASESRVMARAMDWCEVRIRKIAAWVTPRWRRLPSSMRVTIVILGACCSTASAYLLFRLMRG